MIIRNIFNACFHPFVLMLPELAKKELIVLNEKYKPGSMRDIGHKVGCGLVGLLIGTAIAGAFVCPPTLGGSSDDKDLSTPSGRDPFTGTPH